MKCQKCGKEILDNNLYCLYCGTKQEDSIECPKCHFKMLKDEKFCGNCGYSMLDNINQETSEINISNDNNDSTNQFDSNLLKEPKSKKPLIIVLAIVGVVVIVGAIVLFVFKPFDTKTEKVSETVTTTNKQNSEVVTGQVQTNNEKQSTSSSDTKVVNEDNGAGVYVALFDEIAIRSCPSTECNKVTSNGLTDTVRSYATIKPKTQNAYVGEGKVFSVEEIIKIDSKNEWAKLGDGMYICAVHDGTAWIKKK